MENKYVNMISKISVQMPGLDTSIRRLPCDSNDPGYLCTISKVSYLYPTTSCNNLTQQPPNTAWGLHSAHIIENTNMKGT